MSNMLSHVQKMFKTAQSDLEANYLKELAKRSGKDKLDFMVEVNKLIVGQSELSAFAAHIQKGVLDKLTPKDLESMGVNQEEINEKLKYVEVLVPISGYYDK